MAWNKLQIFNYEVAETYTKLLLTGLWRWTFV